MNRSIIIGLALTLAALATSVAATEVRLIRHLELTDADNAVSQYVVVDTAPGRDHTGMTAGILETAIGGRIVVSQRTDLIEGLSFERFEDHSAGWWAEWVFDYGFRNLSNPADFADPMQAAIEAGERARRAKAPEIYTLTVSSGASVEWVVPWGATEQAREAARREALAKMSRALAKDPLPESATTALAILAGLQETSSVEVVGDDVIPALWDAARAAQDDPLKTRAVQVSKGEAGERPRLLKVAKRSLEGE